MKPYFKDALEEGVDYTGVIKSYMEKNGRLIIHVQLDDSEDSEELFISSQKITLRKKSPYYYFCKKMGLLNDQGIPIFKRLLDMPVIVQLKAIEDGTMFVSSIVRNDYDGENNRKKKGLEELSDYYGTIRKYEEQEKNLYLYIELDDNEYEDELFVYRRKIIMKKGSSFYQFCKSMGLLDSDENFVVERLTNMPVIVQFMEDKNGDMYICDIKRIDYDEENEE